MELQASGLQILGADDGHVGQVAVLLEQVQAVAEDELVGDLLADVVGVDVDLSSGGLVQECAGLDASGTLGLDVIHQELQGIAGVNDILDDQDVAVGHVGTVEVDLHLDVAIGLGAVAVGIGADELHLADGVQLLGQVDGEHDGALQNADDDQVLVGVVTVDLLAEAGHDLIDLFLSDQEFLDNKFQHKKNSSPVI